MSWIQGPLKLWNVDKNQIEGEIMLSDTKFQPFVVRAHGQWGETKRCLPLEIRWEWFEKRFVCIFLQLGPLPALCLVAFLSMG